MLKMNLNKLTTKGIQNRQKLLVAVIALGTLSLILFLVWISSAPKPQDKATSPPKETHIETVSNTVDNQAIWVHKSEAVLEQLRKDNQALSEELQVLKSDAEKQKTEASEKLAQSEQQLTQLLEKLEAENTKIKPGTQGQEGISGDFDFKSGASNTQSLGAESMGGILKGQLQLQPLAGEAAKDKIKTIERYIPAGSHVKAVILGGVDASASVSAQSDPKPVLLRLVAKGTLPNHFESHLQDCNITAAAFGDISSERALIRLETMSCVEKDGKVHESQVAGYVAGEDGVTGVRGQVVYRERELLNHSLLSGILSGIGKGIEGKFKAPPVTPVGAAQAISNEALLQSSLAGGASNALDNYAEYHIKRAEQYQPTIQVGAGRKVDVVFTKGFEF